MTVQNINLWAEQDGIAPRQSITDHPSLTQPNPLVTISTFKSTTDRATPRAVYSAPIYSSPDSPTNALQALEALTQVQTAIVSRDPSKPARHPFYSFAKWRGSHTKDGHHTQSAIVLEYAAQKADAVANILATDCGVAFYVIPTIAAADTYKATNCYLFALPVVSPCGYTDAMRVASLVAQVVGQKGLTVDSWKPTYLFKMRSDSAIHFLDGEILDAHRAIGNAKGTYTNIVRFER